MEHYGFYPFERNGFGSGCPLFVGYDACEPTVQSARVHGEEDDGAHFDVMNALGEVDLGDMQMPPLQKAFYLIEYHECHPKEWRFL
ncbi:MAG: hypothetical protein AVO38_04515 [delta proteobacterium ML8_D]|nr:MAG: hypothetical protein AVO38_04515 [delta proteobacterium ML8_D]